MTAHPQDGPGVASRGPGPDACERGAPHRPPGGRTRPAGTSAPLRRIARARAFRRDAKGAAAVEFALVAIPFVSLIAAILQNCLIVWVDQNLDDSLQRAIRVIYTGTFQTTNSGQTNATTLLSRLKEKMCGTGTAKIVTAFDCNNLKLDVTTSSSFAAAAVPVALNASTKAWATNFGTRYTCAAPGSIVVVTAAVKYPVAFSFLNVGVPTFSDGSRLLQSTAVFRTEPNDTSSC